MAIFSPTAAFYALSYSVTTNFEICIVRRLRCGGKQAGYRRLRSPAFALNPAHYQHRQILALLQVIFFMEILMGMGLGISPLQMAVEQFLGSLTGGCLGLCVIYVVYGLNGQSFDNSVTKAVLMVLLSGECALHVSFYQLLASLLAHNAVWSCRSYCTVLPDRAPLSTSSAHDILHVWLDGVWYADSLLVSIHDWSVQLYSVLVVVQCHRRLGRLLLQNSSTAHNGRWAVGNVLYITDSQRFSNEILK